MLVDRRRSLRRDSPNDTCVVVDYSSLGQAYRVGQIKRYHTVYLTVALANLNRFLDF